MSKSNTSSLFQSKAYPWVVIGLCASLLFYKYILNVSPSIMPHQLMRQFNANGAQLGSLAATFFYVYTVAQLFVGVLLDKYGARWLTGSSIMVAALGTGLFSTADNLMVATIARGMMGFGIAFATVTYLKMTTVWFKPNQMAFVGSLLVTAVMLGAVFGQAPMAALMHYTNWRFVLVFCSLLGLGIAVLFMALIRDKADHPSPGIHFIAPPQASFNHFATVLKNKQNWLLTLYSGLAFAPLSVLGGLWGNPFLQEAYHLSSTQSAGLISLMFIGLGIGGPLFGLWSDKLANRVKVMKYGIILSLIAILMVIYSPTLPIWLLAVFLFLLGCGVAAFMLGFTVGTQINALPFAATVIALINTGDCIFESVTEPLLGKLLDLGWTGQIVDGVRYFSVHDYHYAFIPLPLYFMVGLVLLFFIDEPKKS